MKLPILFLMAILGVSLVGGFVLGGSFLKERWEPRITQIDTVPIDPGKTELSFGGGGYPNERCEYYYLIYTSWSAKRFQVVIERFSEKLQVLDGNKRVEAAPYALSEGNLPEQRCIWLSFTVIMPNKTGTYELDLHIRLFSGLFSKEYEWGYAFKVEEFVPKPPPKESLTVILDKERYYQGDNITIAIANVSNETICFGNSAYDLHFERWNDTAWEFYDGIPATEVLTYLERGEEAHVTWKLGAHIEHPFPTGHYRVGTHGVYAEFEVI